MKENITLRVSGLLAACAALFLGGCSDFVLLNPSGTIGQEQKTLILTALIIMLMIVVPVIIMTLVFAWRYRASNKDATYAPEWSHSSKIEVVVWVIPAIVILVLGTLVWKSSNKLDPYRPLESTVKPVVVEAISLDWKWLFIYPEQGVATVNHLVVPANVPVHLHITSTDVMNSFFIPKLGSQIFAMPGMHTQLHLIATEAGTYDGLSSNYSGRGFSDMNFKAVATSNSEFEAWLNKVKQTNKSLDLARYKLLELQSEKNPVEYFSSVKPGLFDCVLHKYMHAERKLAACEEK